MIPAGEKEDSFTGAIIGRAIAIHRVFGPGVLESVYETFLTHELRKAGFKVEKQPAISVDYDGIRLDLGFRPDLIVDSKLIVEIKAVKKLKRVHESQILSYMRLTEIDQGLLINFHVHMLRDGIRRLTLKKQ
jgi:GxxExxY protein